MLDYKDLYSVDSTDKEQGEDWEIAIRKLQRDLTAEMHDSVEASAMKFTQRLGKLEQLVKKDRTNIGKILIDIKSMKGEEEMTKSDLRSLKAGLKT